MRIQYAIGFRDQTDAVAQCCGSTYYRHSGDTWFAARPWSCQMSTHAINCHCGAMLTYEEVSS